MTVRAKTAQAAGCLIAILAFCCVPTCYAAGPQPSDSAESPSSPAAPLLENGFRSLYELNFTVARANFVSYQQKNPADAMGAAAEAASYLYEQFNAKGIFSSSFFLNDDKFLHGADGTAAENCNTPFLTANNRARAMAKQTLKTEPHNAHALLVLTLADGMESDYDAMIVKKQIAGLGMMRQAEAEAAKLLAVDPDAGDAYLALGASNYVIGNLSALSAQSCGSVESTATRPAESSKCSLPPTAATTCGPSPKLCWPWPMSASATWILPAPSSPAWLTNSRPIRCTRTSSR
jgi:hypothetical protein